MDDKKRSSIRICFRAEGRDTFCGPLGISHWKKHQFLLELLRRGMQHPQTRKKNIWPSWYFFTGKSWLQMANRFSPPSVAIWTLQDARDIDGVTLKRTFLLAYKEGHESTARASFLHSEKDSVFTGEKKRGRKRKRKSKFLSAGRELGQI